jgi:hypothetical protein
MSELPEVAAYRERRGKRTTRADHTTHYNDCGCLTEAADAAIAALEREVAAQTQQVAALSWCAVWLSEHALDYESACDARDEALRAYTVYTAEPGGDEG